jgi:hypothetical protein
MSAKTGVNVNQVFEFMAKLIFEQHQKKINEK